MQVQKAKPGFKQISWFFGKKTEIPNEWNLGNIQDISKKLMSGGTPSTANPKNQNFKFSKKG